MCGIAGTFGYSNSSAPVDQAELLRVRDAMALRGPDGSGLWLSDDRRVGLAHRRLAVIDLSDAGAQPMASLDGSVRIVFNGEIYNYQELRRQLEAKGVLFRSKSDTEVLIRLYQEHGRDMVRHLRGMFSFILWDERERGLFLARDPFGIKPLYYSDDGTTLRAASQVKALLKGGGVDASPEPAGHVGFFLWGHVPEPYTLYRGIRALPAGTTLWIDADGHKENRKFFSISEEFARAAAAPLDLRPADMRARLRDALLDTMRHHMVSDVPVGVFLSAGLDSTTQVGLLKELGVASLRTVTLGFNEFRGTARDEVPLAESVAKRLGADHRTCWVTKDEFLGERQRILDAMDQPSTDGINSYFVSRAAKEAGLKVVISGLGGDELFGSYPSFEQIPRLTKAVAPIAGFGRAFRRLSAPLLKRLTSPKYASLLEYGGTYGGAYLLRRGMYMPWELPEVMDGEMVRQGWDELRTLSRLEETISGIDNEHLKIAALESSWYMRNQLLRDTDWAGMAHSLEVRVPFVDVALWRSLAPMLASKAAPTKLDMAATPKFQRSGEILRREKTGFSIPVREWLLPEQKQTSGDRKLRGWAKQVYGMNSTPKRTRILVITTDAFGGHGGIAQYNRDLLISLAALPEVEEIVVVPRNVHFAADDPPEKIRFHRDAAGGKLRFVRKAFIASKGHFDLVICGHINLLPIAALLNLKVRAPMVLMTYGIDVWQPHRSALVRSLVGRLDAVWTISEISRDKMMSWAGLSGEKFSILPNAIDLQHYGPGPKNKKLVDRYGLSGLKVIMVLCRLPGIERYKGVDEVLELMPRLLKKEPTLAYLIAGDGDDRPRLEAKAESLGISSRVVFAGFISEIEKIDHYRLADAFVMPGRGEGFGFVFLEALACGVPVVASVLDGSREAVRNGLLGRVVNPDDDDELETAILGAISDPHGVPEGLSYFAFPEFQSRAGIATRSAIKTNGLPR